MHYNGPIERTKLAQELIDSGQLSEADYEDYAALKVQRKIYRSRLSIQAPTWRMRFPVRTLDSFLYDLADPKTRDKARRDFANIPGGGKRPFFKNSRIIEENARVDRICPVGDGSGEVASGEDIYLPPDFVALPHVVYTLCADLSVSGDATGVALVHFEPTDFTFEVDFCFRIRASHGNLVDYSKIRDLARNLRDRGFRLGKVGFDQFQSNDSFVMLEKEGFPCEIVKFSDSLMGCNTVRDFVVNKRLIYGTCDHIFMGEASELQIISEKRIDHLESGGHWNSKDVWDAVVNAVFLSLKLSREEHGEFLQFEDLGFFDPDEAFEVQELSLEEKALPADQIKKQQLPNNGHSLIAYVYSRFNAETDSDVVTVALSAVYNKTREARVIKTWAMNKSIEDLARFISTLEAEWDGKGFYRVRRNQSIDFFMPNLPFVDSVEEALSKVNSRIAITRSDVNLSRQARIVGAQSAARDGRLTFPKGYKKDQRLRTTVSQLVAYPFVPSEYLLLALEGVVREADVLEVYREPSSKVSRVISYDSMFKG